MNRLIFLLCILFAFSIPVYSQNQSECEYGYCSHCEHKFVYRAWVDHSFNRKDEWTFNRTGVFDPTCNAEVKKEKANQASFDQTKEKEKNGLKATEWWSNGKAKVTSDGNNFAYYTSSGVLVEKFQNGTIFYFEEGKLVAQGPGVRHRVYVRAVKQGKWIENGKAIMYDYGTGHVMTDAELKEEQIMNSTSVSSFPEYYSLHPFIFVFEPNSYNTPSNFSEEFQYRQLSEKLNKISNEITSITIVSHSRKIDGDVTDNVMKSLFVLGLNRSNIVEQELKKRVISNHIVWNHIACFDKLADDYTDFKTAYPNTVPPESRAIEIYVNFKPNKSIAAYEDLKSSLGYQSSASIIPNYHLIKTLTWNIYMNIYGRDENEILENIPKEFKQNVHITKAIQMLPIYYDKVKGGAISSEDYQIKIEALIDQITLDTFNKSIY